MSTAIETRASQILDAFTKDNPRNVWALRDDAPQWMTDAVHVAHGDMLPDDTRYELIRDALIAMVNGDDDPSSFADAATPIYNHDLIAWLASHGSRYAYVDQAIGEGIAGEGLIAMLQAGYYTEALEVWCLLSDALETLEDDEEEG